MPRSLLVSIGLIAAGLVTLPATPAAAFGPSHCIALADASPHANYIQLASAGGETGLSPEEVRIRFVGHSTFVIETHEGYRIATDFTGWYGGGKLPDIVTMNRAHSSHYTDFPDPAIPHVLRGWNTADGPADHWLELDGLTVRNVTSDVRNRAGGRIDDDNSIFIFEAAGLCIGHLGHLHHELNEEQYALIGRLDIVMAAVDGGLTVDLPTMVTMLERFKAQIVLPMHWWGNLSLNRFLGEIDASYAVASEPRQELVVSLATLPRERQVIVLNPGPGVRESLE
ncbi:MAG: MBL fold metallo-hydrolase [Pseudomonadota bacterium]